MILPWSELSIDEVKKTFDTNIERGLSTDRVAVLQEMGGKNILERKKREGFISKLVRHFKSPIVFVLLVAGFATVFLEAYIDATVIFIAVTINVLVGLIQEGKSSRAFEKLNESQSRQASVLRDGKKQIIPTEDLVVGDIVILEGGMYIPADIRLVSAKNLQVNESVLTGEWMSVLKNAETLPKKDRPLNERINMVWMGTLVASGYATGIVVSVGDDTQVGKIALSLDAQKDRMTPLQNNFKNIATFLVYVVVASSLMVLALGLLRGESFIDMLLVAIALAVASMPEGLPAAVTVVLAHGMETILDKGGLVRNLLAAETLGSTTIILTDKTGTLTEAKMKIANLHTLSGNKEDGITLLQAAVFASDAFIEEKGDKMIVHGRSLEKAIVMEGLERGLSFELDRRLDFINFESTRRYGGALYTVPNKKKNRIYASGAPEALFEKATYIIKDGKEKKLTKKEREELIRIQSKESAKGMRVLAVAYQEVLSDEIEEEKLLTTKVVFLGLLSFVDPVREGVSESIQMVKGAGVRVVMVTGDNQDTARAIAIEAGICTPEGAVLTGTEVEKLDDDELFEVIHNTTVFARVLPDQKLRIARVLKNKGEIVAMTGDGVNDAPALRAADIGVAVGSGTEVAKESSDIILINDSFSVIVAAIKVGRRVIDNLKKITSYLLATGFSEISIIGGALIVGLPIPVLPSQILWANIVEEGLMSFAYAFEGADGNVMKRKPTDNTVLTKEIKRLILIVSIITGTLLFTLYLGLTALELPIEEIRTIMFVALTLDSIFFAFSIKSLNTPIWKIDFLNNKYLLVAFFANLLLLVGTLTLSPLKTLLSLVSLTALEVLFLFGFGLLNLVIIELIKYLIFVQKMLK